MPKPKSIGDRLHGFTVALVASAFALVILAVAMNGWDYYTLGPAERFYHPKHGALRPSGRVGLPLGLAGLGCFIAIYLYAARKRIKVLSWAGKTKNWLDFHIVLGIAAPILITFHSSFKMQGLAGIAYWIMLAVMASGVVGRYIYAQIPRSISAAELTMQELEQMISGLVKVLEQQTMIAACELESVLARVTAEEVNRLPLAVALLLMLRQDVTRPFLIARLRRRFLTGFEKCLSAGGLFRSGHADLEKVVAIARRTSWLAAKIAFLSKTQQVFHLWHVVHRPFSYSFAILASTHIIVVVLLGYF